MKKYYLGKSYETDTNCWNGLAFEDFENEDELYDTAFDTIPGFGTMDGSLEIKVISSDYEEEEWEME